MVELRNWAGPIRIALTLLAFRHSVYSFGTSHNFPCSLTRCLSAITASETVGHPAHSYSTSISSLCTMPSVAHVKARCPLYPSSEIRRSPVPDDKLKWETRWADYKPVSYTAPSVLKNPSWADPDIGSFSPKFNSLDGSVDRRSLVGTYKVDQGKPLNPCGRTGLTGRGLLGRWGPNHAADPIVTRWKRDSAGQRVLNTHSKLPVLQFISIKRKDCGEWAIPGGMVDPGEVVTLTLQREFSEEALNSLKASPKEKGRLQERINLLFRSPGLQVYQGYVDDPRNTDNSWMETVAVNFHDETGDSVSTLPLRAGDDAGQVRWVDVDSAEPLYASHSQFLKTAAQERRAHW
ncbi:ADP-ribose pyrophosphatase, mitochondrial isoform X1 [Conger conger]|uniref:ADP-ribose pyrophosphatase, mitochondrial isoform X1 n=2 Tax=Conger conger TaxID=82655 RepID=UPI002A5B0C49|nr:ADP-ribose pyrophosphatase, mitochondrial isoform X1 [Conger conger]XP_061081301.1 ADP-ribose pyrophosphatase, mitochondrial isoform X1 [Conger conger]